MAYTKKKAAAANRKKYIIQLSAEERTELTELVASKASKEKRQRAQILLHADIGADGEQGWTDELIAMSLGCAVRTVQRIRMRCVMEGLQACLRRKPSPLPTPVRKLDGEAEARLIALACGEPPEGRVRWTYQLLADKAVELKLVDSIRPQSVWKKLKKTNFSLT